MVKTTSRIVVEILLAALTAAIVFAAVVAWRLSEGPISLDFVSPYIVDSLTPEDEHFKVELESTVLTWEPERRAVEVHALGVRAVGAQGEVLATAPEVSISFSASALLRGMLAPTQLAIIGPRIFLERSKEGEFRFAVAAGEQGGAPAEVKRRPVDPAASDRPPLLIRDLLAPPDPGRTMGYLEEVRISGADLVITDHYLGESWRAPDAEIVLARDRVGLAVEGLLDLQVDGRRARINLVGIYSNAEEQFNLAIGFKDVEPAVLAGGLPALSLLQGAKMPIDGNIRVSMTGSGVIGNVDIDLNGGPGSIALPDGMAADVKVRQFRASAAITQDLRQVFVSDLVLALADGPVVTMSGNADSDGDGTSIRATVGVERVSIENLRRYWPPGAASGARRWVLANIDEGELPEARLALTGRLLRAAPQPASEPGAAPAPRFELTSVDGGLLYHGLSVNYMDGLPPATGISGGATFDERTFDFSIAEGRVGGLRLASSQVRITGLDQDDQVAEIDLQLTGGLRDALVILDSERLGYPSSMGVDPANTSGDARIHARFDVPLIADLTFAQVGLATEADISDVAWKGALLEQDLVGGNLKVRVDPEKMQIDGEGEYAGFPVDFSWTEQFEETDGVRRRLTAEGTPTAAQVGQLGVAAGDYLSGRLPAKVVYTASGEGGGAAKFEVDLEEATAEVPTLSWRKEAGTPGQADFELVLRDDRITEIRGINVRADGLEAAGNLSLEPESGGIAAAEVERLSAGRTDLRGTLRRGDGGWYDVDVTGRSLDVSGLLEPGNDTTDFELPAMRVRAEIARVYSRPERYLADARLQVSFDGQDWRTIRFSGRPAHRTNDAADGTLSVDLRPEGAERVLTVRSADAGAVIWAFGISDNVVGGALDVSGRIDDGAPDQPVSALLKMTDYTVVKAPLMARILTLASLTGINNLLTGEGIRFSRMEVPLTKKGDIVQVKDARAVGSQLGFTLNGTVNLAKDSADLGGTIVPAYTINSLLGNIPILGRIFVGEKGSGVFAASYSISGAIDDPKISVNPVATLTPGFLRRIFGVPGGSGEAEEEGSEEGTAAPGGDSGLRN